jgi:hypothetical protein
MLDDVKDMFGVMDRNFVAKRHNYMVRSQYVPELRNGGYNENYLARNYDIYNGNFSNGCRTGSGLCLYGQNKENVLPPYEFTEATPGRPALENPFYPLLRKKTIQEREQFNDSYQNRTPRIRFKRMYPNGVMTRHGFVKNDIKRYQINQDLEEKMNQFRNTYY